MSIENTSLIVSPIICNLAVMDQEAPFEIRYEEHTLKVEPIRTGKSVVYKITNERKPGVFFVTLAKDAEGQSFWTSLPEGRLEQAARIGLLIDQHIKP